MKKSILFITLAIATVSAFAQKKTTTSASISFDATTPKDAMPKGENKTVVASLNEKTGEVVFESIIKSFSFANPMMQDHFNSANWMNSEKFATANFKGKITNLDAVNFKADGSYNATVAGELTLHGITKTITAKATIAVKGKAITTAANFSIVLADYGVVVPAMASGKVATEPKITVAADFK